MKSLILKALFGVLKRKAAKSVTSWLGTAVAAAGVGTMVDPALIDAMPEKYRGVIMTVLGLAIVAARHRREIFEMYAKLKTELQQAVAEAEGKGK